MNYADSLLVLGKLTDKLNTHVEQVARDVAAFRGVELDFNPNSRWSRPLVFKQYERETMSEHSGNVNYSGVDYPINYVLGTPLINAEFYAYVGDSYENMFVAFPLEYLDNPEWQKLERSMVDSVNEAKRCKLEEQHQKILDAKRAQFEMLRKEFEQ